VADVPEGGSAGAPICHPGRCRAFEGRRGGRAISRFPSRRGACRDNVSYRKQHRLPQVDFKCSPLLPGRGDDALGAGATCGRLARNVRRTWGRSTVCVAVASMCRASCRPQRSKQVIPGALTIDTPTSPTSSCRRRPASTTLSRAVREVVDADLRRHDGEGHASESAFRAPGISNQSVTEFHRVHTEFHREEKIVNPARRLVGALHGGTKRQSIFSVKLRVHSVKLRVRLLTCVATAGIRRSGSSLRKSLPIRVG
jgi:hypothetical protein